MTAFVASSCAPLAATDSSFAVCSAVFAFESSVLSSDFCSVLASITLFCSSTIAAAFCAVLISSLTSVTAFVAADSWSLATFTSAVFWSTVNCADLATS